MNKITSAQYTRFLAEYANGRWGKNVRMGQALFNEYGDEFTNVYQWGPIFYIENDKFWGEVFNWIEIV